MNNPNSNTVNNPTDKKGVGILLSPELQKGVYSNLTIIHHTQNEFILDFIMQLSDTAQVVSRIIISPEHARLLEKALRDNIKKYDYKFKKKRKRPNQ